MGYGAVGEGYNSIGQLGRANEYYTKAFQLREHASEREKLTITANYYRDVTGELDKAAQAFQKDDGELPAGTPRRTTIWASFPPQRGQYEKAAEIARQAMAPCTE